MERLTKSKKVKISNGEEIIVCKHDEKDCNDSCMYMSCEWYKKVQERLWEYENAEEQGLLIKLPCKVEDTLYLPYSRPRYIKEVMVTAFMFNGCNLHILTDFVTFENRDIGKTVFLTKEEAEQALAEKKGE